MVKKKSIGTTHFAGPKNNENIFSNLPFVHEQQANCYNRKSSYNSWTSKPGNDVVKIAYLIITDASLYVLWQAFVRIWSLVT